MLRFAPRLALLLLTGTVFALLTLYSWALAHPNQSLLVDSRAGHTCALLPDGDVQCWGMNVSGQLGRVTVEPVVQRPALVEGLHDVVSLSAGALHTCAVRNDQSVWCWGQNNFGQLGDGSLNASTVPVKVRSISNAKEVATGVFHSCALLADSTVKCWGYNGYGQLGDRTFTPSARPIQVSGLWGVTSIAAGGDHNCSVMRDRTIRCWGWNAQGQAGVGSYDENITQPTPVVGIDDAVAVTNGDYHTCALRVGGTVVCWGLNGATPTSELASLPPLSSRQDVPQLTSVATGNRVVILGWTEVPNADAYVVSYAPADADLPAETLIVEEPFAVVEDLENHQSYGLTVSAITDGRMSQPSVRTIATPQLSLNQAPTGLDLRRSDKEVTIAWNGVGGGALYSVYYAASNAVTPGNYASLPHGGAVIDLADTTTELIDYPTDAPLYVTITALYAGVADGQLGDGSYRNSDVPVPVLALRGVTAIDAGYANTCALLRDRTVRCWGRNLNHELGGTNAAPSAGVPVKVPLVTGATDISVGETPCAVISSRFVSCWGYPRIDVEGHRRLNVGPRLILSLHRNEMP